MCLCALFVICCVVLNGLVFCLWRVCLCVVHTNVFACFVCDVVCDVAWISFGFLFVCAAYLCSCAVCDLVCDVVCVVVCLCNCMC